MSVRSIEPLGGSPAYRQPATPVAEPTPCVYCFSIQAQADPGVMPRVLQLFAKRNLVPVRWHSDVLGAARADLAIDVQVEGVTPAQGDYIARCLRQIPGVTTVLTAEKHPSAGFLPGALSA